MPALNCPAQALNEPFNKNIGRLGYMGKVYKIEALWDGEAKVWVAEGVDVPGLCTEAATMEQLVKKLEVMVPEMLAANGVLPAGQSEVRFELIGKISGIGKLNG